MCLGLGLRFLVSGSMAEDGVDVDVGVVAVLAEVAATGVEGVGGVEAVCNALMEDDGEFNDMLAVLASGATGGVVVGGIDGDTVAGGTVGSGASSAAANGVKAGGEVMVLAAAAGVAEVDAGFFDFRLAVAVGVDVDVDVDGVVVRAAGEDGVVDVDDVVDSSTCIESPDAACCLAVLDFLAFGVRLVGCLSCCCICSSS
jgi:hypothetical protein